MKIAMLSAGTRGDIQPLMALGIELKNLGNEIVVSGSKNFADFVQSYGLLFSPVNIDISKVIQSGQVESAVNADNPLK